MSRPFLFGGNTGNQSQNKYLVEFRAGKMTMKGKMVHPDKRKGMVYVHQTEDSLMHFCWKDRNTGVVEDDLIIFPEDAEFKKVSQCTTGRVFVLKFKLSSRRCFYWMQEPKTDKDEDYRSKVNEYLNNPPVPGSGGHGSSGQGGSLQSELSNLGGDDIQNLLNNMSHSQLVQLLGTVESMGGMSNLNSLLSGVRPSSVQSTATTTPFSRSSRASDSDRASATPTPVTASATTTPSPAPAVASATPTPTVVTNTATPTPVPIAVSTPASATPSVAASGTGAAAAAPATNIQLSDLQTILSGLSVPADKDAGGGASAGVGVDLSQAITAEALQPLLNNQALMDRVRSLLPNTGPLVEEEEELPSPNVPNRLKSTLQSPQFQHALSVFSAALQSGQLGPLMQQFGMTQEVVDAANSGNMDAFIRALQSSQAAATKEAGKKKDEKDEEMALD